jgi:superoxide dismutase, Fe-Mn family
MNPKNSFTRREVLKTLGVGAAFAGMGLVPSKSSRAAASAAMPLQQPFVLPDLTYDYDALEPHIDARTMQIHHDKHHQGYVNNANKALADYPELQTLSARQLLGDLESLPPAIRTAVRNNVGGHANHSLFWRGISPKGGGDPVGKLAQSIDGSFGSFPAFVSEFSAAAMQRFGSGWVWLSLTDGRLKIHSTANQDSPFSEAATPILGLDVWEHAYYLHYQNRRADYVKAFWNIVDWKQAESNFIQSI